VIEILQGFFLYTGKYVKQFYQFLVANLYILTEFSNFFSSTWINQGYGL